MAITGDHYTGTYEGHAIELVRNNWNKTLKLLIDGEEVASDTCHLPACITLTGSVWHNGVQHEVVAKIAPHYLVFTRDTVEIDGSELPLTYGAPRGITPFWVIGLIAVVVTALLAVGWAILNAWLR